MPGQPSDLDNSMLIKIKVQGPAVHASCTAWGCSTSSLFSQSRGPAPLVFGMKLKD